MLECAELGAHLLAEVFDLNTLAAVGFFERQPDPFFLLRRQLVIFFDVGLVVHI